mmetsp:Transcript_10135/g.25093  ORF Transcript_10135/g.25093 Transcript_10135/m.25093 type:complete len:213 (-) Transcript_10135:1686-2324(-)
MESVAGAVLHTMSTVSADGADGTSAKSVAHPCSSGEASSCALSWVRSLAGTGSLLTGGGSSLTAAGSSSSNAANASVMSACDLLRSMGAFDTELSISLSGEVGNSSRPAAPRSAKASLSKSNCSSNEAFHAGVTFETVVVPGMSSGSGYALSSSSSSAYEKSSLAAPRLSCWSLRSSKSSPPSSMKLWRERYCAMRARSSVCASLESELQEI